MPPLESLGRITGIVLWPAAGYDVQGQATVGEPIELRVRWEDEGSEVLDPQGNTVQAVATLTVDREIAVGSIVWEGTLEDWYGVGSAGSDVGLRQVIACERVPDLKGRNTMREVRLMRFRDSLPEVV